MIELNKKFHNGFLDRSLATPLQCAECYKEQVSRSQSRYQKKNLRHSGVFAANFKYIQYISSVFLWWTLNM